MARRMKDSGVEWIGEIPENTKLIQLRFIADITTGNMDTQNKEDDGEYPFFVRSPIVERSSQYSFDDAEAILMAGDGVGAGRVFHYVQGKYACHQRVYRMSNFKFVQSHFLKYYLEGLFPLIMDQGSAKSTVDSVRLPMLQGFKVIIFNESEQQKIAEFLDEKIGVIDSIIARTKETIEDYKRYRQAIITETVTKGLNPDVEMKKSNVEWIGEIPKHWEIVKAKNVVVITNGSDPKTEGDIPVYGSGAQSFKTCGEYKEGPTVLIGRKGATLHIPHYIKESYWNVDTAFDVKGKDGEISLKYYYYNAICFDYRKYISQTTLPSMTQADYGNMYIPYPNKDEQDLIVEYLDEKCSKIDKLIIKREELLAELESYNKSLVYEYVTGKREIIEL